ncbi:MAG: DEAD/DEAH box helicase, partial [Gammaproteobacteria bacterium]|nr:DEAD/DEAH box helicase [Gammaproteobacteria bacterium]
PSGIAFYTALWRSEDCETISFYDWLSRALHKPKILIDSESLNTDAFLRKKAHEMYEQAELLYGFVPYPPSHLFINPDDYRNHGSIWSQADSQFVLVESLNALKKSVKQIIYALPNQQKLSVLLYELQKKDLPILSIEECLLQNSSIPQGCVVLPCFNFIASRNQELGIIPYHMPINPEQLLTEGKSKASATKKRKKVTHLFDWDNVQFMIHEQHGIGKYHGLKSIPVNNVHQEFIELEYAGGDRLYIPADRIDLLVPYHVSDMDSIVLHKLGQQKWKTDRDKLEHAAADHAAELLAIYATRQKHQAPAHQIPEEYVPFQESFPFEETVDQQQAIEDVLSDLQNPMPMDRLICGDVGFGKTEVALRAAFVSAMNNHHVFLLAPTTILAAQHFETFSERLRPWGISVVSLTRQTASKQLENLKNELLKNNRCVVIGTHKILYDHLTTENLGLLIVDEEHRFGVSDKERLRKMRGHVHLLSMTGTPIPRTLALSLQKFRDLSLIATPPNARRQIMTTVHMYDSQIVKKAIERELFRQGQVYYLCNDVARIPEKMRALQKLCPDARFDIAHGQMSYKELQISMAKFYQHQTDVLICSTIIENGIDVASAHSILIEDAHHFGLAQLHQLRGRVGRSAHQAYAYCLIPVPLDKLSPNAVARLEALTMYQELGSGYHIAVQDLEIRGAGDVLGHRQSGHVPQFGIDYYQKVFERAQKVLTNSVENTYGEVLDLGSPVSLSSDNIHDPALRLALYQQWSEARTQDDIAKLTQEFQDRFGLFDERSNLWREYYRIRTLLIENHIHHVKWTHASMIIVFQKENQKFSDLLIKWIQKGALHATPHGQDGIAVKIMTQTLAQRLQYTESLITNLCLDRGVPPTEFSLSKETGKVSDKKGVGYSGRSS